ncbi:MAG TPA: hypothetical protein VNX47_05640 [Nevskia sp.]|nr:hypothetical protein [Nevskia sp.]
MSVFRYSLIPAALALSACSTQVTMQNAEGQQVACEAGATSTGVASRPVRDDLLTQCVDRYRFQGYEIVAVKK